MTTQKQKLFLFSPLLLTALLAFKPVKPRNADATNSLGYTGPFTEEYTDDFEGLPDSFFENFSDTTPAVTAPAGLSAPQVRLSATTAKAVDRFLKRNKEKLQLASRRSLSVFPLMESVLERYGVPAELKYLAVVESNLKPNAASRVGAVGHWQLMAGTARELGLKVSKKGDERKNCEKSTAAAAKYLRDLYGLYGDWLLVIAAYNSGPGTLNKAIRRSGSRNFWALQSLLPTETRAHVKHYIGTHYYFERKGGETTLTKSERVAFAKEVALFKARVQKADSTAIIPPRDSAQRIVAKPVLGSDVVKNK